METLIALYQRDARPERVEDIRTLLIESAPGAILLLHGRGHGDALVISVVAPRLAYGSVLLIANFPEEIYAEYDANLKTHDYCAWDKFGSTEARAWVRSHYDGQTYASHRTYLLEAVARTKGQVLELGSGDGSTPALHETCTASKRLLVTIDSDPAWLGRYHSLASEHHKLELLPDPALTAWLEQEWGVVFIDHAPGHSRGLALERARGRATYIVVHDTEELGYGLEPGLSRFRYRKDFRYSRPWTTVVSETREIW